VVVTEAGVVVEERVVAVAQETVSVVMTVVCAELVVRIVDVEKAVVVTKDVADVADVVVLKSILGFSVLDVVAVLRENETS
jgi:hypothetical protein